MVLEMGKTLKAAVDEAAKCAWGCRYYAEHAERFLADEVVETSADRSLIVYQPIGPILAVMPWNFPFWQVFRFAAPALAAGNVGLLKHASNVPQCALAIEEIFRRAGFPEGCFQTLLIDTERVQRVIDDPRVVAVTLTGSNAAGSAVGSAAARQIKKSVLELGGSDPFIVMPSANLDAAAGTAVKARMINNGQSCIAAKRFIAVGKIADEFERRLVAGTKALVVGDPMDPATDVGPLANEAQVKTLTDQVQRSVQAGARLLTGGHPLDRPGYYFAPGVLTDITADSPAYHEEVFGPVALLFRARDIDEAIRIANDSPFGLGASAWTNDERERRRFIAELEAGMVFINAHGRVGPAAALRRRQAVRLRPGAERLRAARVREHQDGVDQRRFLARLVSFRETALAFRPTALAFRATARPAAFALARTRGSSAAFRIAFSARAVAARTAAVSTSPFCCFLVAMRSPDEGVTQSAFPQRFAR